MNTKSMSNSIILRVDGESNICRIVKRIFIKIAIFKYLIYYRSIMEMKRRTPNVQKNV